MAITRQQVLKTGLFGAIAALLGGKAAVAEPKQGLHTIYHDHDGNVLLRVEGHHLMAGGPFDNYIVIDGEMWSYKGLDVVYDPQKQRVTVELTNEKRMLEMMQQAAKDDFARKVQI